MDSPLSPGDFRFELARRPARVADEDSQPVHRLGAPEQLAQQWNESITSYRQFELKFRIRRRDGLYRWHLGRVIPQYDDAERMTGWILTATDIEIENQALIQAEAANRIKDEFLATVSHELRNPLNAIVGWVNLLQTGNLDADGAKRAHETIERNVHLQVSLIDEILDLSRIARGKVHLTLRRVDLIPLIESALRRSGLGRVRVRANDVLTGGAWALQFRDESPNGHDKAAAVRAAIAQNETVAYIGDGYSDYEAALAAHVRFAKRGRSLERYLRDRAVEFTPFSTFAEVEAALFG